MNKITVIIPIHNSEKYIERCLKSVMNQTLQDIDMLCMVSGIDSSLSIVKKYSQQDKRVRVIYDGNNSYGHKINQGILLSDAEYIGIVESDDYIEKHMMEKLYRHARETNVDLVKANYYKIWETLNGETRELSPRPIEQYNQVINLSEDLYYKMAVGCNIWSGIYKSILLKSNLPVMQESEGASFQDVGFSIFVSLLAHSAFFLQDGLYNYRIDNPNSSVKQNEKYDLIPKEYDWVENQLKKRNMWNVEQRIYFKTMKVDSFYWNYSRLSPEYQNKYLCMIKNTVKESFLDDDEFISASNTDKIDKLNFLVNKIDKL